MSDEHRTLTEQAIDDTVKSVREETPDSFHLGAYRKTDGTIGGGVSYDRHWSNGWGATAYAKAWWHDAPVTPIGPAGKTPKLNGEVGGEIVKTFGKK